MNKDSVEVIKFMDLYGRLTNLDLQPCDLIRVAEDDEKVRQLCIDLHFAAWVLRRKERSDRQLFSSPTEPNFIRSFRDFEDRFDDVVTDVWFADLDLGLGASNQDAARPVPTIGTQATRQWEIADESAFEKAKAIEVALEFALDEATQEHRGFPTGFPEAIEDAAFAWRELRRQSGLNLRGILRRRALVPFVMIPRHVNSKYGTKEKFSLLRLLQEAHDCFIFGQNLSSIMLMRSVVEQVLRDHYRAGDRDTNLKARIDLAVGLPLQANKTALQNFRRLSNAVVHSDESESVRLKSPESMDLELQIVRAMSLVRALIEGTPSNARPDLTSAGNYGN